MPRWVTWKEGGGAAAADTVVNGSVAAAIAAGVKAAKLLVCGEGTHLPPGTKLLKVTEF